MQEIEIWFDLKVWEEPRTGQKCPETKRPVSRPKKMIKPQDDQIKVESMFRSNEVRPEHSTII